jgi:hypothetical protein
VDDSDSDLDDLHHILEESMQQLHVAQSVLTRHRKDAMDTGIYLQPQKYVSIVSKSSIQRCKICKKSLTARAT